MSQTNQLLSLGMKVFSQSEEIASLRTQLATAERETNAAHDLWCAEKDKYSKLTAEVATLRAALEVAKGALYDLLPLAMEGAPKRSHIGSCGPESGCDGICMEVAEVSRILRNAHETQLRLAQIESLSGPREAVGEPQKP